MKIPYFLRPATQEKGKTSFTAKIANHFCILIGSFVQQFWRFKGVSKFTTSFYWKWYKISYFMIMFQILEISNPQVITQNSCGKSNYNILWKILNIDIDYGSF